MSYAARHALDECISPAYQTTSRIDNLDDKDLKAFIEGAGERASDPADPAGNELWKGIVAAAEKRLEIRKIRKSGKGKWFAAIEKMISEPEPSNVVNCVTIEYREGNGKDEAVAAAREMLARHAHHFDDGVNVEARIYPEIEWAAPWVEGQTAPAK